MKNIGSNHILEKENFFISSVAEIFKNFFFCFNLAFFFGLL